MVQGNETRAFLSYSREDKAAVESLERDLEECGLDVWIDSDLTGGQAWWELILERIRGCECFLFALSPDSLDSEACEREFTYALAPTAPHYTLSESTERDEEAWWETILPQR